jgi:hypothetical protein
VSGPPVIVAFTITLSSIQVWWEAIRSIYFLFSAQIKAQSKRVTYLEGPPLGDELAQSGDGHTTAPNFTNSGETRIWNNHQ